MHEIPPASERSYRSPVFQGKQVILWVGRIRELPETLPRSRQSLSTTKALESTRGTKPAKGVFLVANERGIRPYQLQKFEPPGAIKQVIKYILDTLLNTRESHMSSVPIFKQVLLLARPRHPLPGSPSYSENIYGLRFLFRHSGIYSSPVCR